MRLSTYCYFSIKIAKMKAFCQKSSIYATFYTPDNIAQGDQKPNCVQNDKGPGFTQNPINHQK